VTLDRAIFSLLPEASWHTVVVIGPTPQRFLTWTMAPDSIASHY